LLLKGTLEVFSGDLEAAKATAALLRGVKKSRLERAQARALGYLEALIAGAAGRHDLAAEGFEAAVKALPKDVPYLSDGPLSTGSLAGTHALILYVAAGELESSGRTDAAQGYYMKLVGLNGGRLQHPDLFALSHYALGRILESQGESGRARRAYETFLEIWKNADPGRPEIEEAIARLAAL
ncbi:MAG: hypothetical protein R6X21_06515, partial [Candidatus Aminicenantes bacterium]